MTWLQERIRARQVKLIAGNTIANGSQNTDKDGKPIFSANNIDLDDPLGKKT